MWASQETATCRPWRMAVSVFTRDGFLIVALATSTDPVAAEARLDAMTQSPVRLERLTALQWAAHLHENRGDGLVATGFVEQALALWRPEDGIWMRVNLEMQLAQLAGQRGDLPVAARHALAALPDLVLIGADDDAMDALSLVALDAIRRGDLALAEELADSNADGVDGVWSAGGTTVTLAVRAEVAQTVLNEKELEEEMRHLLAALEG